MPLKTKWENAVSQMAYWPRTIRLIWAAAPRWTTVWAILLVLQGILPALAVYIAKLLVDALVVARSVANPWSSARHLLLLVVMMAGVLLLSDILQSAIEWVRVAQAENIQEHIRAFVHEKAGTLDLAFYETPEYFDLLEQTRTEAGARPIALLESFGTLIQNGLTLCAMAAMLIAYGPWLPLVLLISTIPAFYVVLRFERSHYRWWQAMTPERRWAQYFDTVLTHSDSAAEVRVFDLNSHFVNRYQTLRRRLISERLKRMRKLILKKSGASLAALVLSGAAMATMAWRVMQGHATLGDLALFYGAFSRGQSLMQSLLNSVGQIFSNSLYLKNLYRFLDLKPSIVDPEKPKTAPLVLKNGISFEHVNFAYPGTSRMALKDFSLFIPSGKIVAIVGANGAGKSTLLKLLCRLYEVRSGRIELDGIDIRSLRIADLRRMLTVLFQFPVQYHAAARENIAIGDLTSQSRKDAVEDAARLAGADQIINALPNGYDSILGKWFVKGEELSGGEWQRVALARAYVRNSPIIVLDEPTSFMDSWSEADWFDRFRRLAAERTGLVITHRFTIAMRADIIHVMDDGRIVESGTHHDLVAQDGLYAQSWLSQMQAASTPATCF